MFCLARRLWCMLGRPNGIATLNAEGKLTESQRPNASPAPLGGSVMLPFTNSNYAVYFETNAVGGPRSSGIIGLGTDGYVYFDNEDSQTLPSGPVLLDNVQGAGVLVPTAGTITQFTAMWQAAMETNWQPDAVGLVHAVICRATITSAEYFPIMETILGLTPTLSNEDFNNPEGTDPQFPTRIATATGLSIPVDANDRLMILYYLTGNQESIFINGKCSAYVVVG